jgi:hypothetical protein
LDFGARCSLRCLIDDADFLVSQAVEFVDELVDQFISCVDLPLGKRFLAFGFFSLGVTLFVIDIPTKSLEERVDELSAAFVILLFKFYTIIANTLYGRKILLAEKDIWNSRIRAFLGDLCGLRECNERAREKAYDSRKDAENAKESVA